MSFIPSRTATISGGDLYNPANNNVYLGGISGVPFNSGQHNRNAGSDVSHRTWRACCRRTVDCPSANSRPGVYSSCIAECSVKARESSATRFRSFSGSSGFVKHPFIPARRQWSRYSTSAWAVSPNITG